jgi:diguanylate cyclase (GGDEF)-like protein
MAGIDDMRLLLIVLCLLVGWNQSYAAEPARSGMHSLHDPHYRLPVGSQALYLLGRPDTRFEDLPAIDPGQWQPNLKKSLNLGHQAQGVWIQFQVTNQAEAGVDWLLNLTWPVLDRVQVRLFYPQEQRWGPLMQGGDAVPLSVRPRRERFLVYPLDLPPMQPVTVFMHIQAAESLVVPMQLVSQAQFEADEKNHLILIYLFFGGMLAVLLYNACLYFFTHDRSYIFYTLYLASIIGYELTLTGLGQLYFWAELPRFSIKAYGLFAALTFLCATLFARYFLEMRRYGGWVYWCNNLMIGYWSLLLLTIVFYPSLAKVIYGEGMSLFSSVLAVATTSYLWYRGNFSAKLFTLAWSLLILFTIIHLLAIGGALPLNLFTLGSQMLGAYAEFILLSIGLAERINRERAQRLEAQRNALLISQDLARERDQALQLQHQANERLEQRVNERTSDLQATQRELEQAVKKLASLSVTDGLTQLYNRRHLDATLEEEMARSQRSGSPLSVLLLDIDHFKQVNDRHGHVFGDLCLRAVAQVLSAYAQRAGDMAARYGGEEFLLMLPATDEEQARQVAENVRLAIKGLRLSHQEQAVSLTASIGLVSLVVERHHTLDSLLQAADQALYRAKHGGRNQVVCHS